jgi:glycosyltransferase involved in cell wall biosynthesis
MNILHITSLMDPQMGGVCQAIRTIVSSLNNLGLKNEILSMDSIDSNFLKSDDLLIHAIGEGKGPWRYNKKIIPWLENNISKFDVIILHGLWQYNGYALHKTIFKLKRVNFANINKIKVYVMPHGMLDPYFQKAANRKLKALRNLFYWKLIEHKLINGVEGLLFTCNEELIRARLPFRPYYPKKEINVGFGIASAPTFNIVMRKAFEAKCTSVLDSPYLLFLSRIHEIKGIDLLVKSYETFLRKHKSCSKIPKLVIAGPGLESEYGQKILKLVSISSKLKDSVIFTGMLTGDAKWGAFYGCDAFVLPSHQESFGIAVVEALSCGKPVLISNKVNIWREIAQYDGGFISDDTEEGTLKLLDCWWDLSIKQKISLSENARIAFKEKFSVESTGKSLFNMITS